MPITLGYARSNDASYRHAITLNAISAAIDLTAAALLVYANISALWHLPPNSYFRSAMPFWNVVAGGTALILTLAISGVALILGRRSVRVRILSFAALLLGLLPLIAGNITYLYITESHHLSND